MTQSSIRDGMKQVLEEMNGFEQKLVDMDVSPKQAIGLLGRFGR